MASSHVVLHFVFLIKRSVARFVVVHGHLSISLLVVFRACESVDCCACWCGCLSERVFFFSCLPSSLFNFCSLLLPSCGRCLWAMFCFVPGRNRRRCRRRRRTNLSSRSTHKQGQLASRLESSLVYRVGWLGFLFWEFRKK